MSTRKQKDKDRSDRSDRKSRHDSTKNLIEVAPSAIVDQPSSRSIPNQQPVLRRGESDDYYNPRPDTLPGPGYVESPTHYNGGPPPQQGYNGAPPANIDGVAPAADYSGGPSGPQHNGGGHGGYTGGGPIYHAGYGEPAPAHYSQHAGARPTMPQQGASGASADYYHGSGSYSGPPNPPLQHAQTYNVGQGQGQMPGGFPGAPGLQHTQSAPQHGYPSTGYVHPQQTQGAKPPRRDSSSSSSSSSYVDISRVYPLPPVRKTPLGAIRTFFTAPSESRRRVIRRKSSRTLREQRRQGRLAQGRTRSASSSEADSDLAYGSGYLRRRKRRGSRGSRSPGGRRYHGSRSPRRNGYGSPGRSGSVGRDGKRERENYQPASAGGVPPPGLHHSATMPGAFPIETLATAGVAGAIAAGLSRKDSKKSKKDAQKEILKLGEDLHNLAKRQNKFDLEEAAKKGRFNVVRHNEGRHGYGPKGYPGGASPTRGIPSSKLQKPKEDDGWETSDSDDTSSSSESADSAMAFGGENAYQSWKWREPNHPPRSARRDSHQGQARERDRHYPHPPTRKSTIVDPKLFGPQNSLLGVVERATGFGSIDDLTGDGATPLDPPTVKQTGYFYSPLPSPKPVRRDEEDIRRQKEAEKKRREEPILLRDGSSRQGSRNGTREMKHVFPMPTDDPSFVDVARASESATPDKRPSFHARTDSLPLRQPKPMSPVRREVYDSPEVSSKKWKGKEKEKESSRSNDLALGGLAGAALAAGIAYSMSSPEEERHRSKDNGKQKENDRDADREIDSQRMFKDDMARRNGRRPDAGPDRRDLYGFSGAPISAVSPLTTREVGGKVDPFQFQVNDDAWESDRKGKKPLAAHERMAARAAGSFRDSGSSTPRKYQEDIDRDKRREAEYQEQLYSSSPEAMRRPIERTDSGRTREVDAPKPLHERIASRAAESNPDTGRSSPRTSTLDEEAERRIKEVVAKWGVLGRKSTGFADVVLAARKAELEKIEPVYTPPAPEIKKVERAPRWATENSPGDYNPEAVKGKDRSESPPRWRRGEDGPESPDLKRVKGEDAPPVVRRGSSDADHRYASMHDDYFSSKERPRERRRGRSRTRSPSPPTRGRSRTRSRSVVRGRSPSPEIMEARAPKERRPHNTEHEFDDIQKEVKDFTAPYPAEDIQAAIAAEHADQQRHPHDPNHPGHDNVQEDADRYWREAELARKLAKKHNDDPTPRVVTPPAMDHHSRDKSDEAKKNEKGPYSEPDADFRFDHEMHPHELPLFTPVALRKSFSLPEDFDDSAPFDPKLLGLDRPLLNIVRPTPTPEKQAKVKVLKKHPKSRSPSREPASETSHSVTQDDEKPTYGKPVAIEDEPSFPSREITDIPAITEPEQEAEKSVSWGENDTQVYVPVTPYDEARDPPDGSIPSSPETTRASAGGGLPHSHAHEHHKESESHSDSEKRRKDKGKGKADTPEKRPKPKSLWSRFTPDLAKKLKERDEMAYNLANASTIGFADGDEGREVPREEVAELALERGRRFQDPGEEHHHHKKSTDPELEKGEAFEYKGVVVEPEAPRKHKKKSRKHGGRTPSPPAVGPKPVSPSSVPQIRMPGAFSDEEVAYARPRGISPPASDVSTVIYHQPSELSDSAGIATGFNSEIGIRPRGLDNEESFVDVAKPASSDGSFEIVDKQPEETHVITVEPAGEQPESFAVVDSHTSIPSEETQPLIVDAPTPADGPLGDREVLATPVTEDEGFVTPLAEVVTPFDATAAEVVPAPSIVDEAPFLGGGRAISPPPSVEQQDLERTIDALMDAPRDVDTTGPVDTPLPESTSTETETSSTGKKKKKKKGKKSASSPLDEPSAIGEKEIKKVLKEAVLEPENATFPSAQEVAEDMRSPIEGDEASKEIIVDLATPVIEGDHGMGKDKDTSLQGETTSTISPPLDASAEVVASEITEPSRSIEPPTSRDDVPTEQPRDIGLADEFSKADSVTETGGVGELGGASSGVAPLDIDTALEIVEDIKAREERQDKKKKSLFDSDFAAVALAGTTAAVAGIANALIPSTSSSSPPKSSSSTTKQDITNTPTATKEFIDALAESWVAPEMPTGLNKRQKKAWEKKVQKEREEFESAQPNKEVGGEHWSASMEESKEAQIEDLEKKKEVVDAPAPVVDKGSKEMVESSKKSSKEVVDELPAAIPEKIDAPKDIFEPAPEAITTTGEAASYYNLPTEEPISEVSKDVTDAPVIEESTQLLAEFIAPEIPAGLNKKAKKAWTQKVAKEKEEWEAAQAAKSPPADETPAVVDAPVDVVDEVKKEIIEPQVEIADASAPVVEEASKEIVNETIPQVDPVADTLALLGRITHSPAVPSLQQSIEPTDKAVSSTDMLEEVSKDITDASAQPVADIVDTPISSITEALNEPAAVVEESKDNSAPIETTAEVYTEPEMPTGLNKKQKTAWKKKVAKEREEFESAQASKAASTAASGSQTPAVIVDEDTKGSAEPEIKSTSEVVDAPAPVTEESSKEAVDVPAAAAGKSSKDIGDAPIEVVEAAPAINDAPVTPMDIVGINNDIIDARAQPTAENVDAPIEVIHAPAPSTDIVEATSKDLTDTTSSLPVETTPPPVIEVYEEPIMPTGLNKKQKQAWKKNVAKEKEEWESAMSSAEVSARESAGGTAVVLDASVEVVESPAPIAGDASSKGVIEEPAVVVTENVDQPIIEAVQPPTDVDAPTGLTDIPPSEQATSEEPVTIIVDSAPAAPEAGIENVDEAVRAIHDATFEPAPIEPASEIITTPLETPATPLESSAENSSEPPKKMNKRERKAWDKAQREAADAKTLPEGGAAAAPVVAADIPAPVEEAPVHLEAPVQSLETPQFEVPEVLPTPVFEDESGAFATAPPETPLATPLPTPMEGERASDSPAEAETGVVSLSIEDAAALAASDPEAQAGDVSISIEDATALAGEAHVPSRKLSKKEKKAAEKAARAREFEGESSTATEGERVKVPIDAFRELADVPGAEEAATPLETPLETLAVETPAEEAEVSLEGKKKKKKKGKGKAADVAETPTPLETPVETPLETPAAEIVAPTVEQPTAEPVVEHDPVAETLALLGGISHTRALPPSSVQQSIEPVSVEQTLESPTDDDDAFHSAAEDRARSATPTGTVDDDDFHSTNGDGAWHSPRMNGHDQPEVVPEMAKEPKVTETEVTEDDAFAPVKGKKKKKKKGKGVGSGSSGSGTPGGEMSEDAQESFLANAGTLGAGVGSAAAGPRDMNSGGNLGSEEQNADAAGRWESQPISEIMKMVQGGRDGEEEREGTVVGHDEGRDVLASQTLTWGRKKEVAVEVDPVEETRRVLKGIDHSNAAKERRVVSDPLLNDPEIIKREVMPSIDPQFGDLLPLPPRDSPPNEGVDAGALVTDIPPTPTDAPAGFQPLGGIQEQAEPSELKEEILTIDPEIHPRSIRPAIDPQFGDLLELPPSQPGSPVRPVDDDAISMNLPESPPESPAVARASLDGVRESPQTPRKRDTTHSMRSPSINAVPLKFLLGGRSSGSTPSSPVTGSATSPTRPKSRHSWDSSKGLQPLTLLSGMERRHSRGSSLAEFESRSLVPLLEAAAQDKDNMSATETANTVVGEQAVKMDTDGENTDAFATAMSEKQGGEYFTEAVPAPDKAASADIADTSIRAPSGEVVEQTIKDVEKAPIETAPEVYVEPEMPTGLNKKQKTAWKKKVAKERDDWESARSSAELSEAQLPAAQDAPVEVIEPKSEVVDESAPVAEESNKEVVDAPIEVEAIPGIINAPAPSVEEIVEVSSKAIADAPIESIADVSETPAQPPTEEAASAPTVEVYQEPEMPIGLNKKQKQAWKKTVAKEKEEWESARSAQSSAEQSSGGWTDAAAEAPAAARQGGVPIVEESKDIAKNVEAAMPVESSQEAPLEAIETPSIFADSAPASDNVDLENVLQQIPAVEPPSETPAQEIVPIDAPAEIANVPVLEELAQSTPETYQEPEMPSGLNKKQKTAWKKKVAKEKEDWESAQSSAAQSGDHTPSVVDAPVEVVDTPASSEEAASKEVVDAPVESIEPIIEAPIEVVEAIPGTTEVPPSFEPITEDSNKDIVDFPAQPSVVIADAPVEVIGAPVITSEAVDELSKDIVDAPIATAPEPFVEPEMPTGLNKKQKTAWKRKVAKEREDWESAQSSASAAETPVIQDEHVALVEEGAKEISEPILEPIPMQEQSKDNVYIPTATETEIIAGPIEVVEPAPEAIISNDEAASYYNEGSKDVADVIAEPASGTVHEQVIDETSPSQPESYQEPEMPSGLNKKQKTAWKKKVAKEREEFEGSQASAAASGAQTPALEESNKDVADMPAETVAEVVEAQPLQETPKLEIGGFIETPAVEIAEPVLAAPPTEEPSAPPIKESTKDIVDRPVEVASDPTPESPAVDHSQPAKKLNKKQKAALAKKLKDEAESASASTSGGWTDSGAQTPVEASAVAPIMEEVPAKVIDEPIEAIQGSAPTPDVPSSSSNGDFDAAVRALHDKYEEPIEPVSHKVGVMSYLEAPAEGETVIPAVEPLSETPFQLTNQPAFDNEAKETSKHFIDMPATEQTTVFVASEMPTGLNKKQKKAWEKKVQKEREEWEMEQASKEATPAADVEKSAEESEFTPSSTGFSTDAPADGLVVPKTEPIDPTIYDVSDDPEQPRILVPESLDITASEPQMPAIALPAYEGGGEAASYFEGGSMRTPPRVASPALKSLVGEAQIVDDEQVSESAGERGDVDSSAFETSSKKSKKKKKKGKEVAIEPPVMEVQSPVQEKEKGGWADEMDDSPPAVIAAPTMLPAIVKDAFSRPQSPEAVSTPTGKTSKKKKGKKGAVEEIGTPAAIEPSLETVGFSTEPAPEAPFKGVTDKALPDVSAELETAKDTEIPSAFQPLESDANDSPPTPDAVRQTLALLGGISHTREPVIKTSTQPELPAEVADETVALERPSTFTEDIQAVNLLQAPEAGPIEAAVEPVREVIEMPVMPKGLNKKQKKAWEKKNAALIAEAEASQAASAVASGNQTPAIQDAPVEAIEESDKEVVDIPAPAIVEEPAPIAPIAPIEEDTIIHEVPEALRESIAEPSPIEESKPILDDAPLPEPPTEATQEPIEPEVAKEIPLPETPLEPPLETPFESAFESSSSKKKKKKGKKAATVETETEPDPVASALPADATNVLEFEPPSDTTKDVEVIDDPPAITKNAATAAPITEAVPEIPEESVAMVDNLEPSIARNVPLPGSSGDATPADVSTEAETSSAWEEPEMPKGLNKKKKAEWKKKMAKEKEEWESAQASAEVIEDIPATEAIEAPIEKAIEEPTRLAGSVEETAQPAPIIDDTPAEAPIANTPEEPATITDDFEQSIARNVTLPDSALATPMGSESPFESSSSKKSKKMKGKKNALVVEEESSSPATEARENGPKDMEVIHTPAIEVVDEDKEATVEPIEETTEVVEPIQEAITSAGEAAEYCAEASRGITEPLAAPIMETIQAATVEEAVPKSAEVWDEPTMPTGLNKKKKEAWKKKVAKEKEEWESAQASKAASTAGSGAQTPIREDTLAKVVKECKADVEVAETVPIPETPLEEPTPAITEDSPTETSKDAVMDDAPAEPAIAIEEVAKDIPLPETPMETIASSAFESVSSSLSKRNEKGKKGALVLEEEPASPALKLLVETLKDIEPILEEPIDKSVNVPTKEHVTISEPVLHDAIVEVEHPTTPPTTEHVDVSVSTHEESAAEQISADNSGVTTPFVSISINESNNSSERTPDPEKAEEPMENTEAPKMAFLEHSASGNGSSLPREMQEEMEQQVLVSGAGAGGVKSYGESDKNEVVEEEKSGETGEVVDETAEREMPKGLNKKQKKAWEKAEKKRIEEALAAADGKALEDAAKVEVEEISKEVVDEPVIQSGETPVVEEVEDEWEPTRKLSKKEQKAADKKRREEEEKAEIETETKREQEQLAAIEEQAEEPPAPIEAEQTRHEIAADPEAVVENMETPLETPAEDEWATPTRKLSKKEQKAPDKKRRQEEEQAELKAASKREQELADVQEQAEAPATSVEVEEATRDIVEEPPIRESETPAEDEWAPTRKLSKKERKALDRKRSDADEQALIDAAAAATATAAAIATVALVTEDDKPTSPSRDVKKHTPEKQVEVTTPIEESARLDSGNESPPANTKVKRRDKGKGKAIDIVNAPPSAGPTTPIQSQDRSITMENEPPQVMHVRTASPNRGIFQQALEKVVEKQVQQRGLQEKVQENITAQVVKGSWSFSALDDEKEEITPWSASRLPPVLEEDVVLEQSRTPDDPARSRSPIYRGLDKEDSAYIGGAESPKPRPRSWFDPEYVRDSGVLLREKKSSDSQKSFSERANTDEALVRRSWPPVDDEKETVDLRRKKRSSLKESQSSPYEKITPKDIAKAATGLGIDSGSRRSLSKSPALSESPSREFLLRKANRPQTPSDEKHSSSSSRQPSAMREAGRTETPRSASDRQHQRQSSLLESLHYDSPRSFSDNIHNPRTRTPSGISREEYYNRGLSATPTSERGASGLGSVLSRPGSVISNRSVTPSLRRVSGRASTDLRAASQLALATTNREEGARAQPRDADSGSASDNNKPSHQGDKSINTEKEAQRSTSDVSDTKPPAPNEGKKRVKGMAEVYNGFGEGRMGSPRSPTRPHSMRRKQSMQLLDMQAQMAAMAEELAATRQEKAVILQAKEAAERNLDEARREAGKAQQYKAQTEEVRGLLESMTLKNTDLTRQTLDLQAQLEERDNSAQATIAAAVAAAIADKEQELVQLRQRAERLSHDWSGDEREIEELEQIITTQKLEIASLKQSRTTSSAVNGPDYLAEYARDDAYFEQSCQKLFRGVWRWIHAFSDRRKHSVSDLEDIKSLADPRIYAWLKDAFTGNPSSYLADLDKRRLILMALTMSLFHHYIFSKHFFGLTKDQEEASKVLEMVVDDSDISDSEFRHWRAQQFCLLSKSRNYSTQRNAEVWGVTQAVMHKLSDVLPQPSASPSDDQRTRILIEELKIIVKKAAELSNDMRRQSVKYSWRQSERAVWGEKRSRAVETFDAGQMTHAEICVQFMELHRVDEKLNDPSVGHEAHAGLERERQQHIQSLVHDFHVISESEVRPDFRLSWEEMVGRMEEKNRRIEEKGMGVRLPLFPMVVKEGEEGKTVIWKSVVKPVDLKSGNPTGKRRAGGESSVGGSEHGSKHPRVR